MLNAKWLFIIVITHSPPYSAIYSPVKLVFITSESIFGLIITYCFDVQFCLWRANEQRFDGEQFVNENHRQKIVTREGKNVNAMKRDTVESRRKFLMDLKKKYFFTLQISSASLGSCFFFCIFSCCYFSLCSRPELASTQMT